MVARPARRKPLSDKDLRRFGKSLKLDPRQLMSIAKI
jgi:hypothetical protein